MAKWHRRADHFRYCLRLAGTYPENGSFRTAQTAVSKNGNASALDPGPGRQKLMFADFPFVIRNRHFSPSGRKRREL